MVLAQVLKGEPEQAQSLVLVQAPRGGLVQELQLGLVQELELGLVQGR